MFYDKELITHKLLRWEKAISDFKLPDWETIPDIGLYMDQVIVLLSQYLALVSVITNKKTDDENEPGVFTAAAINNYVRLKVMPAPVKKKYYRVHIAYLIIIFTLKQSLGINVIRDIIPSDLSEESVKELYDGYVKEYHEVSLSYVDIVKTRVTVLLDAKKEDDSKVTRFIIQEALTAGFSRILSEKLVALKGCDYDEIIEKENQHKK